LVTGGAGFISSNFVRHLLAATPYEVVSLDALTYAGNLENLADVMAHERLSFVHGDIREYAPMDEEHPLNPRSPYAATKAGADRLAFAYHVTYGLPIVIVRPFNNYGPRQHPEKLIPRFVTQALADEPLTLHGDGHASRDWLFVDDDAEAIEAVIAAEIDALAGEVINIATGVDISVAEIADLVLDALGKPEDLRVHVPERLGQVDRHIGSTEKAERLLGWRARTSFADGLERTVTWYRDNEAWWRGIRTRTHSAFSS
jgi:dTDP-glucose 4,6-dehydratase